MRNQNSPWVPQRLWVPLQNPHPLAHSVTHSIALPRGLKQVIQPLWVSLFASVIFKILKLLPKSVFPTQAYDLQVRKVQPRNTK